MTRQKARVTVKSPKYTYPIVDIFAGPGGLGEGFSSYKTDADEFRYKSVVSIERDKFSHRTLHLRHFLRSFPHGEFPEEYYAFLAGEIAVEDLFDRYPEQKAEADKSALRISLGPENHETVRQLIDARIQKTRKWVLVGGPPCQAYSLVGRSRMMGTPGFENDERHFLYKEYLKIIADHEPPVFVMENVKGILSAKVGGKKVIELIVSDPQNPKKALGHTENGLQYRLYSLTKDALPSGIVDPRLFLVRSEEYGVPQARHRMFIVGVRSDVEISPEKLRPHEAPTVRNTISDLPYVRSRLSRAKDTLQAWCAEIAALLDMNLAEHENGAACASVVFSDLKGVLQSGVYPSEHKSKDYESSTTPPRAQRNQ